QFVTPNLIVSTKFLREHADLVKNWIRAHVELTDWINTHQPEAKKLLTQQIQKETSKALAPAILDEAFGRLQVTYDPVRNSLLTSSRSAYDAGFLGRQMPDLSTMYDLSLLNQVLAEKGKKAVQCHRAQLRTLLFPKTEVRLEAALPVGNQAPRRQYCRCQPQVAGPRFGSRISRLPTEGTTGLDYWPLIP